MTRSRIPGHDDNDAAPPVEETPRSDADRATSTLVDGLIDAFHNWDDPWAAAQRDLLAATRDRGIQQLLELAHLQSGQRGSAPLDVAISQMCDHFARRIEAAAAAATSAGPLSQLEHPLPEIDNGGHVALVVVAAGKHQRLELQVESPSAENKAAETLHEGTTAEIVSLLRASAIAARLTPVIEKLTVVTRQARAPVVAPRIEQAETAPALLARLLADVMASPADPAPRRAYADAVRSRDPERAELIDCQLAMRDAARANQSPPEDASARSRFLAHRRGAEWAKPIVPFVNSIEYYAGFVEYVEVNAAGLAQAARVLPALAPIRHLRIKKLHGSIESLLGLPPSFLNALVTLDVRNNNIDDAEAIAIVTSPHLVNVVVLNFARNSITEATLRAIQLPSLRYVETDQTGAELVERPEPEWDGSTGTPHFRSLHERLRRDLGALPWLKEIDPPSFDAL
jgi:hypothetical protein